MNILMALSQLEVTGAEVYATSIGDRLSADGHSVFYVSDTLSTPHRGQYFKLRFNKRSLPRRLWHIAYLIYLIKRHKIQIVHAHSRASGWSAYIACKLTNTPMVTTVHGRQPVHASRKKFHALGYKAFAVCENIKQQIETALGVPAEQVKVIRNGINTDQFSPLPVVSAESKPIIVIIGRLTGPKGEVVFRLLEQTIDLTCYQVKIYSGSKIDSRFDQFRNQVQFCGHSNNVREAMRDACLVIGGGRVAIEALLCEKTTLAIGEAFAIGIVNENNLPQALESNFGDIGEKELDINFLELKKELEDGLVSHHDRAVLRQRIESEYHLDKIVDQILVEYQSAICHTKRKEVPIIMYHRVINNDDGIGVHGTYIKLKNLDKHFKLIKKWGLKP
ncbi:Glycosyltransferase involved in cell wall bisynthesis [Oceanospirillum multiglobuliferum]|uniref:glycosyltransferase family 4 protein n=1 Tax=Oceanospirillum multiglobuliferum TaxID=64969 RepID=UPI0009D1D70E|nr:glycosyltransferase family 4 protein [Oceanospirillum multiglobuliferum]SKA24736.1 Glycosyltransferase involved in cell wall bisynthesis [Oceanospirillum multiglobuliferum]